MFMKEFLIPFATGLAIFLFGMQVMRVGFENLFLQRIKEILHVLTKTPMTGLVTGALTTAILQSSSAVMLLTIALTNARLLTFRQSFGIILGANIGTCLTTELIAFNIQQFGVYFFILGSILFVLPTLQVKSCGLALGGFGLLFLGMDTMQSITPFIKQLGIVQSLFTMSEGGVLSGIAAGTLLTALIQSSTATTAITMNLMYDQILPLTVAVAVIFGSNIGTCITAVLGSLGGNTVSKQVAFSHVMINLIGVLLFLPFLPVFIQFVEWLTPYPMKQVAHAQTVFNVLSSFILLPFVQWFERIVMLFMPHPKRVL
ncbi:Na/Pi cotransporter family protein [Caldalkalibacillus salinus]|uniref:Na/Pi cotransporter family protein n=1 Tax=Caldalkalibacillus salinus TaxID=2803787 RepID=UPI0019242F0F|nr:Na/Pi symporter [Caldalkalibacillus salinus]